MLPSSLNDLTREALAFAVSKGWLLQRGDSVCLTDAGQKALPRPRNAASVRMAGWTGPLSSNCRVLWQLGQ
jgi:hypothetical protein